MATVLCLSSQVARGYVGASAAKVALERSGHQVWVLPTVVLSSHRGWSRVAGTEIAAPDLKAMLDALEANGWLAQVDAVLAGYMPGVGQAAVAFDAMGRVREANREALVLCDPACGDAPKGLYIAQETAEAICDRLVPAADMARLNAFELAWATGCSVTNRCEALKAARRLGPDVVLVTSVPAADEAHVENLLVTDEGAWTASVPRHAQAPHGTGDFLSGLYLGHVLRGAEPVRALSLATGALQIVTTASAEKDELKLIETEAEWRYASPWPVEAVAKA